MAVEPSAAAAPTVFDDPLPELTQNYADALLNAAERQGQVDAVVGDLKELVDDVFVGQPVLAEFLLSPVRSAEELDRILVRAFEGKAHPMVLNFLRVLGRNRRLNLVGAILERARQTLDRRRNRVAVTVRSAVALDEGQQSAIRDRAAALTGKEPVLRLEVDPSILGGLVVQVGDHLYDASVRQRLEQLRNRLIEGKRHEIQSRRDHFRHPE